MSHKLLRLLVPWSLIGLFVASCLLPGWFYQVIFWTQVCCYTLAGFGFHKMVGRFVPLAGTAASFVVLNGAAFFAFWVWISGRAERSWQKISYQTE